MIVLRLAALSLFLMLSFLSATAGAGEDPITFDPLVVSARGRAASITQTPGGVAVVESDDFSEAPQISVADILADVPGISVSGDSLWGRDVSIRGLTGTSIIVLIDGKRINTATDINARLGLINTKDIERVEVLKGPVSSLYGSGSTGGVINIITRKGAFTEKEEVHGRLSQSGATNPAGYDGYGNLHYDSKRLWLFGSGAFRGFNDFDAGGDLRIPNSGFSDWQGRAAAGIKVAEDLTLELQGLRMEAKDVGLPGGPSTLPSLARVTLPKTINQLYSIDAVKEHKGTFFRELQASLYYNSIERRVLVDRLGAMPVREIRPKADHETIGGKAQGLFQAGDHHIVSGLDGWSWNMESARYRFLANGNVLSDTPVPEARQTSVGVFAEDDWKISNAFTLNLGARLDRIETSNKAGNGFPKRDKNNTGWNVHAGLTWRMNPEWSQSLIGASSYRAADILERFKLIDLGGGHQLKGNPDLDPEKTLYGEYGLHYRGKNLRGDLRLFVNDIDDFITEERVSPTLSVMSNAGKAYIYGSELEGRVRITGNWTFFATVTALKGRDETRKEPLRGIAPVSGTTGVEYTGKQWWARLDSRWALRQSDTPEDVATTAGYAILNSGAGVNFKTAGLTHEIALVLNNMLDARYRNYLANSRGITLYEPGFSAMLTHTLTF